MSEYMILSEYTKLSEKIKILHKKCNREFEMKANNFLHNKQNCPHCNPTKHDRKTDTEFKKEVYELVGDEYKFIEPYNGSLRRIKYIHNVCGKNKHNGTK